MHRSLLASLFFLPLLACDGGAEDVEPKSGTWAYNGSDIVANSCGADPPTDAAGTFTLTVGDGGRFTVDDKTFDNPFECTYEGGSYSCPERIASEISVDGVMATGRFNASISGSLESATALSGTQVVKLSCEGSGCAILASNYNLTLPCEYSYSFTANAQ